MKRVLASLLKFVVSLAIVAYLVGRAVGDQAFDDLCQQSKNWWLLAAAVVPSAIALVIMNFRWHLLLRGLGLTVHRKDAFRLGCLGYIVNLAPVGVVGGDVVKAVLLSRRLGGHKAMATASVVVDRVVGLYMMFVVASAAILATGFAQAYPILRSLCWATFAVTALGGVGLLMLITPNFLADRLASLLRHFGRMGDIANRLIETLQLYRRQGRILAAAALMSVAVHFLFVLTISLLCHGLYDQVAPLAAQSVLVPLAASTGVIPLAMGPFEAVLELLYVAIGLAAHQGLIVALASRIITLIVGLGGLAFFLATQPGPLPASELLPEEAVARRAA